MLKFVNFFVLFCLFFSFNLFGKKEYLKYVKEINNEHVEVMKKKYGLNCYGSGGSMPYDVERIQLMYRCFISKPISIEVAREIEVSAVHELLRIINEHDKIRPFLREYPFNSDRVSLSIAFYDRKNQRPKDGSVSFVHNTKGKIFYDASETRTRKQSLYIYLDPKKIKNRKDPEEWKRAKIKAQKKADKDPLITYHEFVRITEESFEEAKKIVEKTRSKESLNLNAEKFIDPKPKSKLELVRRYLEKVCQKIPFYRGTSNEEVR